MSMSNPIHELAAPTEHGDADAEFIAMRPELVRLAHRMVGSREDAEDAVQEVWFRWRRHQGSVQSSSRWLRTVTRNVVIDRLRSRTSEASPGGDVGSMSASSADPATLGMEGVVDVSEALLGVLGSLSTLESTVFVLHSGLDWSYADIARLIDRSVSAVRQLQHRATQHLAAGRRRFDVEPARVAAIASAYGDVSAGADVFALLDLLAPGLAYARPVLRRQSRRIVHDVAGIALIRDGRLLLTHRRAELRWYPSVWDLPGSHLRHGEPPAACAVRAAKQKIGVLVTNPPQVAEEHGDDFRITVFEGVEWDGEPQNLSSAHHDDIGLFTRAQASRLQLADPQYFRLFDQLVW
jgi:RNA polymerase sigma factor (sigma-70 family)